MCDTSSNPQGKASANEILTPNRHNLVPVHCAGMLHKIISCSCVHYVSVFKNIIFFQFGNPSRRSIDFMK